MIQYLNLLQNILEKGTIKESARDDQPKTLGIEGSSIQMNLNDGFPLLTTKKMYFKGIVCELLWFLRGDTNIKYLVDNNVHIWDHNAYQWYLKQINNNKFVCDYKNKAEFIEAIKNNNLNISWPDSYKLGDLGKVYGYQWRNQNRIDQLKEVFNSIKYNPFSRYHIINAWNRADFYEMALAPCHILYQFIASEIKGEKQLNLVMYQRSVDAFLGLPFNLASMSLFLLIMAKATGMKPNKAIWNGGDVHIYLPHMEVITEQMTRTPMNLPQIKINKELNSIEDIEGLKYSDFELLNYKFHPKLKGDIY